jgi:hypothetical protein
MDNYRKFIDGKSIGISLVAFIEDAVLPISKDLVLPTFLPFRERFV